MTDIIDWAPLHLHSQYSILDASCPIDKIAKKAKEHEISSVAITDNGNLFGAVEFYKACKKEGIKSIIGCELYEAPQSRFDKKRIPGSANSYQLVLLAKNETGYHNLCKLSTLGFLEGFYYLPRIDRELLKQYSEGLICLSGNISSYISRKALELSQEELYKEVSFYLDVFQDNYYLEMQRHPMDSVEDLEKETWLLQQYLEFQKKQEEINQAFIQLSKSYDIPLVATNDTHYMERGDWQAHEILLNIQSGEPCEIWEKDSMGQPKFRKPNPKRKTYASHEYYFKSKEEMNLLFKEVPEALSNSVKIANQCDFHFDFETKHYPVYIPPHIRETKYTKQEQQKAAEEYLRELCKKGIEKRYNKERLDKVLEKYPDQDPMQVVLDRLEYEMGIIAPKGMCDYLLIVWDFIHWAKSSGIPMGPGRGSGAGSIILYLIGITDIEPLRFSLFFERFINPERLSYPDIDVDICMDRRSEVINYTLDTYGKDNVAQIITFGTIKAKLAIKDVGRVLSVPLAKVNSLAKLIPEDPKMTLDKAMDIDVELVNTYSQDEDAKRIIDIGKRLEGSIRNTGIHAAGVIISANPLTDYIPLCSAKDSLIAATQFSMKPVESVGMLKVDFLGLKTLTSIHLCVEAIQRSKGLLIDWVDLPLDDTATFSLLNQGKTHGVFQMESGGMQDLAKQLHLDCFEEIIAVLSLYRPGPMDMIPSFINRKHKREPIEYDHPWMEEILSETYGIMVYQEQVMQIASRLANYSLGEGDVLRRAMGKKDQEEMARQREKFCLGAKKNGIEESLATQIFDKMEKFASYGFNKSHAAAYGYLTYVTAYFKANYPKEWMAALMTCDRDDLTKVAKHIAEAKTMQIDILAPDINEASDQFAATESGIRFAMSGIKGVGQGVVESILEERKKSGSFEGFYPFFKRIDMKKCGKKMIENLVDAGAFDFTTWSRDALKESIEEMYDSAIKEQKEEKQGVMTLFALMGDEKKERFSTPPKVKLRRSKIEILLKEKELLGFFLTGHPMHFFQDILKRLSCISLSQVASLDKDQVFRSAFIVDAISVRIASKSQRKFAILSISDGMVRFELPIWPDLYEEKSHLLKENQLLYAVLQLEERDGDRRLSCQWLDDLTQANDQMIEACDTAYDRARLRMTKFGKFAKKNSDAKSVQKNDVKKEVKVNRLDLALDLSQMQLSDLLVLKELFQKNPGSVPLELSFRYGDKVFALLHMEKNRGVDKSALMDLLKKKSFVLEIK